MAGLINSPAVVQNILDEPIPEAVRNLLLKPHLFQPIRSPHKRKLEKQKTVLQQFDPLHASTIHRSGVKNRKGLLLLVEVFQNLTEPPPFILLKEAGAQKDYTAITPNGHRFDADALAFLNAMMPNTTAPIENELHQLRGLKVSLVLTAELQKLAPRDVDEHSEADMVLTRAYFWSRASSILKPDEFAQKLTEATNQIMGKLVKFTKKESSSWRISLNVANFLICISRNINRSVGGATSRHQSTFHHKQLST